MDGAAPAFLRQRRAGAAAGGRNDSVETALAHPLFEPLRPWLGRLDSPLAPSLDCLNALAETAGLKVESGAAVRFVPPSGSEGRYGDYEMRVFDSGVVETRPENRHDLFNALA